VPAIVMGTPIKTLLKSIELYLASLYAPAIGNTSTSRYPARPKLTKLYKLNTRIDGATPKDTKSARESSSFPISLDTCKNLATLPSYLSIKPAIIINKQAHL
jgi:hypothetical protein